MSMYLGGVKVKAVKVGQTIEDVATVATLTQAEYNALPTKNANTLYAITDAGEADVLTQQYVDSAVATAIPKAKLVTLTVAGWDNSAKTQSVTVAGILADESKQMIIPMPATASMTAYNDAGIQCTGQAENTLTFTADTVPTAAIQVYVTYQDVISV